MTVPTVTSTTIAEIADEIFRISTFVPEIGPSGFTFNQFLVRGDEPLLYHTGPRSMCRAVGDAMSQLIQIDTLRWIAFGHVEADECGGMNMFLGHAAGSQVVHGTMGCLVSVNDMANRPPRPLADGEVLEAGGRRFRHIDTPHVPHGWDSAVMFEETSSTLFCGDLFSHLGNGPAVTVADLIGPAEEAETMFAATALTPSTAPTIRALAALKPVTLAIMHGSSFIGDCPTALNQLADCYDARHKSALEGI
jgi:flavorubredoxin